MNREMLEKMDEVSSSLEYTWQLKLAQQMNLMLLEEGCFEGKIQKICSEIDAALQTYTTFTYFNQTEVCLGLSTRFELENKISRSNEGSSFYRKLLNEHQTIGWSALSQLNLHKDSYLEAVSKGCKNSRFISVYTAENSPIGYFIIYGETPEISSQQARNLCGKLIQFMQLVYKIEMYQQQIERLTYTDSATNLPSYNQFLRMIERYKTDGITGVIKIIEPGEFSKIVELYGRPAGERLLKELGRRLRQMSSSKNSDIARFTSASLIMFSPINFQAVVNRGYSIIDGVNEPFLIKGQQVYITLKVGIAPLEQTTSCHDAIRFAESALTKSKLLPGTQTNYYLKQIDQNLERELLILNHFKQAIQQNEITAHFQPKYEPRRGRITSFEALARWISPELGFISPADFIPIAESTGLIRELELHIIEMVLKWQQQRQYDGKRIVPMAINISPDHFYHPLFIQELKDLIQNYYADPQFLIIEITENMGLFDFERARIILQQLRALGVATSVDDFGIGYSSLSYLQKLSFTELKIDQSFSSKIDELATQTIVKSVIQIAHMLEMIVIAEGVETKEQRDILKRLNCDVIQGYYYSRPLPLQEATALLDGQITKNNT